MDDSQHDTPWSIPMRDAGPEIPQRAATWVDRLPVVPIVGVAVLVFTLVVAAVVVIGGDPAAFEPTVLGTDAARSTTTGVASTSSETTESPATAPTTTVVTTTTVPVATTEPTAEAAVVTSDPPLDPEPAGLPIRTPADLAEGWVAQVSSVPASAGGAALSRSFATVVDSVPDAVVVRGSEWPALRAGFWVIVRPGYDAPSRAVSDCDAWGRRGRDVCFARYLSAGDDTQRVCWRDDSGALAGDCS